MIELPWTEFKEQVLDTGKWSIIYFDVFNHYYIYGKQNQFTVLCKVYKDSGADQTDFDDNYKPLITNIITDNNKTRFEREDIRLQMARGEATPDVSGDSEISIKLPGDPGELVYVGGGYAFTNNFTFGDKVTNISIVDIDNILGMGAHTVIATYHDDRVDAANQGWYMWPAPQAGGEIEVEPLGFYGEVPAGLYIELYFKTTTATKVYCDFFWGKQA